MVEISRRTALAFLGAAAIPSAATVAVAAHAAPELPVDKVNRLAYELADALNEYGDGRFHAVVRPSGQTDWPVDFRVTRQDTDLRSDLRQKVAETSAMVERAYPGKQVSTKIQSYNGGADCNVLIMTHDGDLS